MRLIKLQDEMTKYKPEEKDFSEATIKKFVDGVLDGKIKVRNKNMVELRIVNTYLFSLYLATSAISRPSR